MKYTLVCRDSATALEALPEHSVRAIMQDPPAGMDLMGLDWERLQGLDFAKDLARVFAQERRVLKPGHWSLTWAHPKTSHWTAVALELSGFEVVTKIVHLNPEAKSPAPGKLLAPGHEDWILARAPGPPQPLNIGMWQSVPCLDLPPSFGEGAHGRGRLAREGEGRHGADRMYGARHH